MEYILMQQQQMRVPPMLRMPQDYRHVVCGSFFLA
jgi:hypothetical protein